MQSKYSFNLKTTPAFKGLCPEHSPRLARVPPAGCWAAAFWGPSPTLCVPSLCRTPLLCLCGQELCPCPCCALPQLSPPSLGASLTFTSSKRVTQVAPFGDRTLQRVFALEAGSRPALALLRSLLSSPVLPGSHPVPRLSLGPHLGDPLAVSHPACGLPPHCFALPPYSTVVPAPQHPLTMTLARC